MNTIEKKVFAILFFIFGLFQIGAVHAAELDKVVYHIDNASAKQPRV